MKYYIDLGKKLFPLNRSITGIGTLKTLKRFKDEVPEVQSGQECGMAFENYEDIRPNDVIEIFEREEIARKLD